MSISSYFPFKFINLSKIINIKSIFTSSIIVADKDLSNIFIIKFLISSISVSIILFKISKRPNLTKLIPSELNEIYLYNVKIANKGCQSFFSLKNISKSIIVFL